MQTAERLGLFVVASFVARVNTKKDAAGSALHQPPEHDQVVNADRDEHVDGDDQQQIKRYN